MLSSSRDHPYVLPTSVLTHRCPHACLSNKFTGIGEALSFQKLCIWYWVSSSRKCRPTIQHVLTKLDVIVIPYMTAFPHNSAEDVVQLTRVALVVSQVRVTLGVL